MKISLLKLEPASFITSQKTANPIFQFEAVDWRYRYDVKAPSLKCMASKDHRLADDFFLKHLA